MAIQANESALNMNQYKTFLIFPDITLNKNFLS